MDFNPLLRSAATELCRALEEILPRLAEDWWSSRVFGKLSYQQQDHVKRRGLTELKQLDLAALLRVIDKNWYEFVNKLEWESDDRNFLKEMQTIRNRWAHQGTLPPENVDLIRDADTLSRFMKVIDPDSEVSKDAAKLRDDLIAPQKSSSADEISLEEKTDSAPILGSKFRTGEIVGLRDTPSTRGAISKIDSSGPETRYIVFYEGEARPFYESQLIRLDESGDDWERIMLPEFMARLSASQIRHPSARSLYSLNAARIDFEPYQYQPVLRLLRSDQPRLLIADSVGVGKTIEAGLLLRELQARQEIRRVLIICPKALVIEDKWRGELKRFDEDFTHLDGRSLRYCIENTDLDGEWPTQYERTILPFSVLTEEALLGSERRIGLEQLDPPPHFDLVIVDEAHYIRNPETLRNGAVSFFCQNADAVVFLTATPIQMGERDLYVLLNTLRPDVFVDETSFRTITAPNQHINAAASYARNGEDDWAERALEELDRAANTEWGVRHLRQDPGFQKVIDNISSTVLVPHDEDSRALAIAEIESSHTLNPFMTRTLRRDIGEFTTRRSITVSVEFSDAQRALHDAILDLHTEIYQQRHGDRSVQFFLSTIRRQAASCIPGLAPMMYDMMGRRLSEMDWLNISGSEEVPEALNLDGLLTGTLALAENFDPDPSNDPKFLALRKILDDKANMPNNRVMVFSTFRHTLAYLERGLQSAGFRVGVVHGGVPDDERRDLRARFTSKRSESNAIDVLLFSEVGSEGLDYQFCDCMVNYDLPWNPMRIDQRIGRIDRRGQKSEAVAIYNLIIEDTIDAEIYHRCLMRIGVFERALGWNEIILGDVTSQIEGVADDFSLTEEERKTRLDKIAQNAVLKAKSQETLEKSQMELFGLKVPGDAPFEHAVNEATSSWLSPDSIRHLVSTYIRGVAGLNSDPIRDTQSGLALRLSKESRQALNSDASWEDRSQILMRWKRWVQGDEQTLSVVFDSDAATEYPNATFLSVLHPLVVRAGAWFNKSMGSTPFCSMQLKSSDFAEGDHFVAIYEWDYRGLSPDSRLIAISDDPKVASDLLEIIPRAVPLVFDSPDIPADIRESLDALHYEKWSSARADHAEDVSKMAEFRKSSLQASHEARITVLDRLINEADSDRIVTMRRGERTRAEADFQKRMSEIDRRTERSDIHVAPLVFGILRIVKS